MAKSQLILADGEEIKGVLEGELFATSTNPLVNLLMHIWKIILMIFGTKAIAFITVTNRRIVVETCKTSCYVFEAGGSFETILPQGIASISYSFVGTLCGCFLKKYMVEVATNSGRSIATVVKGGKKAASDFANLMIAAVVR